MALDTAPNIADWYQTVNGETFEIVAYDRSQDLIEIQYFDGTVEELDLDTWYELNLVAIEAPEDWSGSMDIEKQDYGVDLDESMHLDWGNPLDTFDA